MRWIWTVVVLDTTRLAVSPPPRHCHYWLHPFNCQHIIRLFSTGRTFRQLTTEFLCCFLSGRKQAERHPGRLAAWVLVSETTASLLAKWLKTGCIFPLLTAHLNMKRQENTWHVDRKYYRHTTCVIVSSRHCSKTRYTGRNKGPATSFTCHMLICPRRIRWKFEIIQVSDSNLDQHQDLQRWTWSKVTGGN